MEKINFFILVIVLLANLYLILIKDYFREKGKNIATKEDIEEITTKIENVKLELEYSKSQKKKYQEENKLALINFYDDFIIWCEYSVNNISVSIDLLHSPEQIRIMINDFNSINSKVLKTYWRICLFEINNQKLANEIIELYSQAEKLHNINSDYLIEMENLSICLKFKNKNLLNEKIEIEYKKLNDNFENKHHEIRDIILDLPRKLLIQIKNRFDELYTEKTSTLTAVCRNCENFARLINFFRKKFYLSRKLYGYEVRNFCKPQLVSNNTNKNEQK